MLKRLLIEFMQFFSPFPEVGSLAYALQLFWYDLLLGRVSSSPTNSEMEEEKFGDVSIWDDLETAGDFIHDPIFDIPTYLRNSWNDSSGGNDVPPTELSKRDGDGQPSNDGSSLDPE